MQCAVLVMEMQSALLRGKIRSTEADFGVQDTIDRSFDLLCERRIRLPHRTSSIKTSWLQLEGFCNCLNDHRISQPLRSH